MPSKRHFRAAGPGAVSGCAMSLKILLVDDNRLFLKTAQHFLGTLPGVEVVGCAHNGREALVETERLRPDLVLLDISMPEMNGFEVAQALRSQPHPPHIVFLTLHDNPAYRTMAYSHGAAGFVSKADFSVELGSLLLSIANGGASHDCTAA